jgi:AraC family transcriptional regulator
MGYTTMPLYDTVRPGWHFGTRKKTSRLGRFILSENQCPPNLRTPWHGHETAAFCLVLRGRYIQRFRRRDVVYQPSVVLFRPPGIEHTDQVSPEGVASFFVEPEPAWLAQMGLEQLNGDYALARSGPRARWLLEQIFFEFCSPDRATPLALEGLVLALSAEFVRQPETPIRRPPAWLERTREALNGNLAERLTLAALAAEAGVHPVHLAAAFRAAYGTTVGQYLRARRIEEARSVLLDRRRSINEVALSCGFSSQSHFTRVFRKHTGTTPWAYRRLHRVMPEIEVRPA